MVQYEYCCDLESYFTYPNPNINQDGSYKEKDPEHIKFPRCDVMIPHPTPAPQVWFLFKDQSH